MPKSVSRIIAALSAVAGDALQRVATRYGEGNVEATSTLHFTIKVEADKLDGGFIAECIELPGCISEGETEKEALENVFEAIGAVLEVRMQDQLQSPDFEFAKTETKILTISP